MKEKTGNRARLLHIQDAIALIFRFVQNKSEDEFAADLLLPSTRYTGIATPNILAKHSGYAQYLNAWILFCPSRFVVECGLQRATQTPAGSRAIVNFNLSKPRLKIMEYSPFTKFELFGNIGDEELRRKLANSIYSAIQSTSERKIDFSEPAVQNFLSAINQILNNQTMRQLCHNDPNLAQVITTEILNFIVTGRKQIAISKNPHEAELLQLQKTKQDNNQLFQQNWEELKTVLQKEYKQQELDVAFYDKEFKATLQKNQKRQSFESIREHLTDKWQALLFAKQTAFELDIIDKWRKKFCADLYKRIEELKQLQDILSPITSELGYLWDLSKGNWRKANFDILKHYADLLKNNEAITALAEMLGRMRQAEREYEEELFTQLIPQPKFVIEPAHKSDLIGVHESDDLSSMLPSETAYLSDPVLQSIFIKKFAEKKLQTFEYQSRSLTYEDQEVQEKRKVEKQQGKGPFIICVDTSGSMHGAPETVAKTLCFAILKIALQEKRKCYLISFSTRISTLPLTDIQQSLDKLIAFLQMSFHGGTDATPAVKEALKMLETEDYKNADVLMISDFVMAGFDAKTTTQITQAQQNKTRFHSLVIGNSQNTQVTNTFDHNWAYNPNNPDALLTLVRQLKQLEQPLTPPPS